MPLFFDLQGHRGARGLKPENTLPSFEAALDVGVTTIETDLHLTRDGEVVLCHDPRLNCPPWSLAAPAPPVAAVAALALAELRCHRADRNPDPVRFPAQDASITPLAVRFARHQGYDPYALVTLAEFLAFTAAYAGDLGKEVGKTDEQRARAARLRFDLELKRVPFHPEAINDHYTGQEAALLETRVVEAVRAAGVVDRTTVRSFDHRCVRHLRALEPGLTGAVLVAETAPVSPAELARRADAVVYCPSYVFLDEGLVREAHAGGVRVVPWTVNDPAHWQRLLDWGVDGITTDFPDRLAEDLRAWGIVF